MADDRGPFEVADRDYKVTAEYVIIVAKLGALDSHDLTIQDFIINERSYIPIFLDWSTFDSAMKGTGFEKSGIEIKRDFLFSILEGTETLLLNFPGGRMIVLHTENLN